MFNLLSIGTVKDAPKKRKPISPIISKKILSPGSVYGITGSALSRSSFQKSEYDLGEVAKVIDIEAYVRQAFGKYVEQCMKEGYKISSRNPEATNYIRKRLREIGDASNRSFDSLLRGTVQCLVAYSNAFIVKVRNQKVSSGKPVQRADGRILEPVAGYFVLDPTSIEIKRKWNGKILKYKQSIPGADKQPEFNPEDVIHIFYDRKEGFAFGTPFCVPVLDDIRSLRRMEENVEMLTLTHLFPLYQYIVGTEENPAEVYDDGTTEVDVIKSEIERMPTEGSIVTPERHEIKNLGAEGKALKADGYLRHFELRVLAGLGISEISLGRGGTANRATAATIDKGMQDRCKDFQDVVETFINDLMMKELLYEGGYVIDEDEDNFVKFRFNEIDIDNQIKMENHSVFKYEHEAITETEVREALGKDPISEEQRNDMFFEHVTKPKAIIMAVDEPYTVEAKANGAMQKVSKEEKKKRDTNNRNKPTNQHGTKTAKTREKKDELLKDAVKEIDILVNGDVTTNDVEPEVTYTDTYQPDTSMIAVLNKSMVHQWDMTRQDILEYVTETYIRENKNFRDFTPDKIRLMLKLTKDSMVSQSAKHVYPAFNDGIARASRELGVGRISLKIDTDIKYKYLDERIEHYINGLMSELGTQLVRNLNPDFSKDEAKFDMRKRATFMIMGVFDALKYRINFTAHTEIMKAQNFGYALAMREAGIDKLHLQLANKSCNVCLKYKDKPLSLKYFSFEDVAPLHPMCNCTYTIRK